MGGKHIDRPITLSPATVAKIFKQARALDHFNVACDSKAKNIANTGKKTLSYVGADGQGSCVYNYSDNKNVARCRICFWRSLSRWMRGGGWSFFIATTG